MNSRWLVALRSRSGEVHEVFEFASKREASKFAAAATRKWRFECVVWSGKQTKENPSWSQLLSNSERP